MFTTSAYADQKQALIGLFTPWVYAQQSIQKILSNYTNHFQQSLPDQELKLGELNWKLSGIEFQVNGQLDPGVMASDHYSIHAKNISLSIHFSSMAVDQIVERVIGGVTFRTRIQAQCGPIVMTQPNAEIDAQINYSLSGNEMDAALNQFAIKWQNQSWVFDPIQCQGPKGFNITLTEELKKLFAMPDFATSYIKNKLNEVLQSYIQLANTNLKLSFPIEAPAVGALPLTLTLDHFQSLDSGFMTYQILSWDNQPVRRGELDLPISSFESSFKTINVPTLFAAEADMMNLIRSEILAMPDHMSMVLNEIADFKKLLDSRFAQFAYWPDLLNFSKSSLFQFILERPRLEDVTLQSKGTINFRLSGAGQIQAQRDHQNWDYLELNGTAAYSMLPQIQNGNLTLSTHLLSSQITEQFSAAYRAKYDPRLYIDESIKLSLAKSLETILSINTKLPSLNLGVLGVANFNGWQPLPNHFIKIPLKMNTL